MKELDVELETLPKRISFLLSLLALLAISANAQKVSVGFDRAADFSKFKTYTWGQGRPAKNPQIDREIVTQVEQQLKGKGLVPGNEGADLKVFYYAVVVNDYDQATVARPGTWGPRAGSMDQVWQVIRGALVLEFKDGTTDQEVWRANAVDTLSNDPDTNITKDMNKAKKKIKTAVDKMFKNYPPK